MIIKPQTPIINWGNPITTGLVFDAPLSERGGTAPRDIALNGVGAFGATAPTWTMTRLGYALDFPTADGNHIVSWTTKALVNSLARMSMEILVNVNAVSATNTDRIFEKGASATPYFSLGVTTATKIRISSGFATANNAWDSPVITTGIYYHIIVNMTKSGVNDAPVAYFNGRLVTFTQSASGSGASNADTTQIHVGNRVGTARAVDGQIVYARYWNRALLANEAVSLYENPWQIYV